MAELTTSTRNQRLTDIVLWSIAVAYVGGSLFNAIFPNVMIFISLVLLLFPFVLIHGAKRDGWKGMAVFVVITLIVSGILENLSILTGFPFGHYYYTDALGPKVALVPLFIAPSYVSFGYLSWVLATVIVNEVHRKSTLFITIAVPLVASFMMVAWDFSLDPRAATIGHNWIWTQGGGYFGVPISNFLGWSFTVYVFYQLFALYLRRRGSENLSRTLPTTHYLQAILVYLWTGVAFVLSFLFRGANVQVTDAVGHVWQTADIYEATALSAIYTMIFISILALVILFRDPLTQKKVEVGVSPGSVDLQRLS